MKFFCFNWFGQRNPSRRLINHLKYFYVGFEFVKIFDFRQVRIFSVYIEIHSAYSQFRKSLSVFSVWAQFHSAYFTNTQRRSIRRFISSRVFSLYIQIHSVYSQYTVRTDSFGVFSIYVQIHSAYSANAPEHSNSE
jgi:hypothetical protein